MPDPTQGVPLAPLTTLQLGGPADRLVRAGTTGELIEALRDAESGSDPLFLIAGGSNVVIADAGVRGTAIQIATRGIESRTLDDGRVELTVQAGEVWDEIVARAVNTGLAGIECLSGIPGSVGATPIQNVGAYGQEVASTITSVRVFDRDRDEVRDLNTGESGFGYRSSRFKGHDRLIVLAASFALMPGGESEPIQYPQLAEALGVEVGQRTSLAKVRETVLALRRSKSMVIDPDDPDSVSAGSFFTNPILTTEQADELKRRAIAHLGPDSPPPAWPAPGGKVKTSAAWLIERSGFERGYGNGQVGLSRSHTLALVNRGGATTTELVAFAREIVEGVHEAFGVDLVPEPVFVGHSW